MARITKDATRHLKRLHAEKGLDGEASVRILRRSGRLGMTFSEAPQDGDTRLDQDGVHVYIARELADPLDGSVIDVEMGGERPRLVVRHRASVSV